MRFDIISLFPESFESYLGVSILKRAQKEKKIEIAVHDLRSYTTDKHRTVDDTPYGGGAGMVLKIEPLVRALSALKEKERGKNTRVILFSAKGKKYHQADAQRLSQYARLILIAGRYEGVDERVTEYVDEELSVGDYVLTGGELPAMIVIDSVARLLPGVLGNAESVETESHTEEGVVEYPQYTKPEVFEGKRVPEVLLSGHHAAIEAWRRAEAEKKAQENRLRETKNIN